MTIDRGCSSAAEARKPARRIYAPVPLAPASSMSHGTARWFAAPARFPRMRRTSEMPATLPVGATCWAVLGAEADGSTGMGVMPMTHTPGWARLGRDGGGAGGSVCAALVALEAG